MQKERNIILSNITNSNIIIVNDSQNIDRSFIVKTIAAEKPNLESTIIKLNEKIFELERRVKKLEKNGYKILNN